MFSCTRISNIQLNTIVQFVEKNTEIYKIYTQGCQMTPKFELKLNSIQF